MSNRSIQIKGLDTILNKETVFLGKPHNVGLSTLVRYKKFKKLELVPKNKYLVSNKLG